MIAPAREIPRLNLPTKPAPELSALVAVINRWADAVQTALTQHGTSTAVANQSGHVAKTAALAASTSVTNLGNTPVVAPDGSGNLQQGSLNKLPVAPLPVSPVTQDNLPDGALHGRTLIAGLSGGYVHNMKDGIGSVRII